READAVGGHPPMHDLDVLLQAGLEIVDPADIHLAGATLAEFGEPEPAMSIEHQVVRSPQPMLAALFDHALDLAALHIHALDRAAEIILRLRPRHDHLACGDPAK